MVPLVAVHLPVFSQPHLYAVFKARLDLWLTSSDLAFLASAVFLANQHPPTVKLVTQ